MHKCHFCGAPATVHLTKIVNKTKHELHLCGRCEKEQELLPPAPAPQINLPALLQLLLGHALTTPGENDTAELNPASLTCPTCGLEYAQFRADGRLGCPDDYDVFRPVLEPLLERVHRGTAHAGKVPAAVRRRRRDAELADLRAELRAAVAAEDYERAADLRDRIRQKEAPG